MEPNIDPLVPVVPTAQPTLPSSYNNQKSFPWLALIFALLLTTTLAAGTYFFLQTQSLKKQLTNTASTLPTPTATPTASVNIEASLEKSTWKHYILNDNKSSIDSPEGWKLTDNTKQEDIYQDGNLQWAQNITLEKDGYKLESINPLAWGPGACIFPDSPDYDQEQAYGEKYEVYTEFSSSNMVFRRVKLPHIEFKPPITRFSICSSKTGTSGFGMVSGFGSTTYEVPLKYDENILKIMDKILISIK